MPVRPEEKIRCSFCGKNQDQVRKMIAGTNGVYICDECSELCSEILEEELETWNQPLEELDDYVIERKTFRTVYNHYRNRIEDGK